VARGFGPVARSRDTIGAAGSFPRARECWETESAEAPALEPAGRIAQVGARDPPPDRQEIARLDGGVGRKSPDPIHRVARLVSGADADRGRKALQIGVFRLALLTT
jgi:hypothetical protein